MFDNAVLAEPDLATDPTNDGCHALPNTAMGRESIPYLVILPEEQIAFFTYTWVTAESNAGAAFALFGCCATIKVRPRVASRTDVPARLGHCLT